MQLTSQGKVVTETFTDYKELKNGKEVANAKPKAIPSSGQHPHPEPKKSGSKKSGSKSSSSDSDSDEEDRAKHFANEVLQAHNECRAKHGAQPLKHSRRMSRYAAEWANKLAAEDKFEHRPNRKYGENIFMTFSSNPKAKVHGSAPVDKWYSEMNNHHFGIEPRTTASGHFTQVVWKDSKKLGIAMAKSKSGHVFVVANYKPAGNAMGSYMSASLNDEIQVDMGDNVTSSDLMNQTAIINPTLDDSSKIAMLEEKLREVLHLLGTNFGPTTTPETTPMAPTSTWAPLEVSSSISGVNKFQSNVVFSSSEMGGTSNFDLSGIVSNMLHSALMSQDWSNFGITPQTNRDDFSSQVTNAPGPTEDSFAQEALAAHNRYRAKHGAQPLTLNAELTSVAEEWSQNLAQLGTMQHRPDNKFGENIFMSTNMEVNGATAVDYWYDEANVYNYHSGTGASSSGHFTQVVWKGTQEMGIARAKSPSGTTFIVANYNPRGNILGQYQANVEPPQ
eukprot:maker-scaffold825_size91437-snap-gene-0.18 protein:Tk05921 transcript:maker-scaffold825_size91437-snap-gene-0.18-mRNA-1 annotation:"golgi-associated plant pathogenesis-related protein 1"